MWGLLINCKWIQFLDNRFLLFSQNASGKSSSAGISQTGPKISISQSRSFFSFFSLTQVLRQIWRKRKRGHKMIASKREKRKKKRETAAKKRPFFSFRWLWTDGSIYRERVKASFPLSRSGLISLRNRGKIPALGRAHVDQSVFLSDDRVETEEVAVFGRAILMATGRLMRRFGSLSSHLYVHCR